MSRISLTKVDACIYLSYKDYSEKRQLKDFYKIYKKASGFIVKEYQEENETVIAVTENTTSVLIGFSPDKGCFIRSNRNDINELIKNAFQMLCYRYSGYSEYKDPIEKLEERTSNELSESIKRKHEEINDDEEIYEDLKELISIREIA